MNRETILLVVLMNFLVISHGIEFRCEFRYVSWLELVGTFYTCENARVSVNNNSMSLESVEGVHVTGKSNDEVRALSVRDDATKMQNLPKNIDKFFPNLEAFVWQNGNLTSITADDLRSFSELKLLYLGANKIVSLDANLFQHNLKLKEISFWNNQITNVGYDLLENLNELTFAYFLSNPCINSWAQTPLTILLLKEKLRTQCPPLATTQSTSTSTTTISTTSEESCNVRCTMNDEVDELIEENKIQREINAKNEKRIVELENRFERYCRCFNGLE